MSSPPTAPTLTPETLTMAVAFFDGVTLTEPTQEELTWPAFIERLSTFTERWSKGGRGFSAAEYKPGTTRGNENIKFLSAAVVEVDHGEPMWELLDGLEYFAFTSFSHFTEQDKCDNRPECPHWRIALPTYRTITPDEWTEFRARLKYWICPNADEGAKDLSRFNYLPHHKPGAPHATRHGKGRLLDPSELKPVPEVQAPAAPKKAPGPRKPDDEERPGDRLNATADWGDILGPVGARYAGSSGDTTYWRRPGKRDAGHSATTGGGGYDVLYMFSSAWPPFDPGESYTKFRAYSLLNHDGDDTAAARELARQFDMGRKPLAIMTPAKPLSPAYRQTPAPGGNGRVHVDEPTPPENSAEPEPTDTQPPRRPLTQLGNSERLVDQFGDCLLYCHPWNSWLTWDGRRWRMDTTGRTTTWAKEVVRNIYREAGDAETKEERAALASWAKSSEAEKNINAMIALARSALPALPEDFDTDPWLLNTPTGTIDLRTGELREHRRGDYITKLIDTPYDLNATAPRWEAFLERVLPDEQLRHFVRRAGGYSATGSARERCVMIPYGPGKNGKGVFLQTVRQLLGEYAVRTPSETFLAKKADAIPNDVAALRGARFAFASETGEGRRLAEATIKDLTGGEDISARFMRGEWFSFTPTFTPWLDTNHRPIIRGSDPAIWDRIRLIPFMVRIPDDEQDPTLTDQLRREYAGILAWIVRGAVEWHRDGLGTPAAVRDATANYQAEMDLLGAFIGDNCVVDPQAWVLASELYKAYCEWSTSGGERPLTATAFALRLVERGFTKTRLGPRGARTYSGLRMMGQDEGPATGLDSATGCDTNSRLSAIGESSRAEMLKNLSQPVADYNLSHLDELADDDGDEYAAVSPDGRASRASSCWRCKQPVASGIDSQCDACGWLVCDCGACAPKCPGGSEDEGEVAAGPLPPDRDRHGRLPGEGGRPPTIAPFIEQVRANAARAGWPELRFGPFTVGPGEDAWLSFTSAIPSSIDLGELQQRIAEAADLAEGTPL
jgi:P4 family phage/plasmid primase-like protien